MVHRKYANPRQGDPAHPLVLRPKPKRRPRTPVERILAHRAALRNQRRLASLPIGANSSDSGEVIENSNAQPEEDDSPVPAEVNENSISQTEEDDSPVPADSRHSPMPKQRNASGRPPYNEMILDAVSTLKERNGSSQYAIKKHIEEKYADLPRSFKTSLRNNLKKAVESGKLVNVEGSYKLPSAAKAEPSTSQATKKKSAASATKPKPKESEVSGQEEEGAGDAD